LAQVLDEGQSGDGALTLGQSIEQVDESRRQICEQRVHLRRAGQDDEPLVAGTDGADSLAGHAEGRAGSFRGGSPAADRVIVNLATHDYPAHLTPARPEGGSQDCRQWVGRRCQEPLKFLPLSESERRESLIPVCRVQLGHQFPQPGGRSSAVVPRADNLAEKNQARPIHHPPEANST
jgi:hypothetical protein